MAGAVWTSDVGRAHRVAAKVKAGTFWINTYKMINVASPFGGYDSSGYGRSSGVEGLHEYTQVKSVWVETAADPAAAFGYVPMETHHDYCQCLGFQSVRARRETDHAQSV